MAPAGTDPPVPRVRCSATETKTTSSGPEVDPDLQNAAAAVVIQQLWRKYRQKCGNIGSLSADNGDGGGGGGSVVGQDYAATVIQAWWRGFSLRRRLASALAASSRRDAGEDDALEELDVDEFVCDEAALEEPWTVSEDPPPSLKVILPPALAWRPQQARLQVDSPETPSRTRSGGLSQRSEKILEEWGFTDRHTALLMLKRARKMMPAAQKKRRDPSVRPSLGFCSYPLSPVEPRSRRAQHNKSDVRF